MAGDGVAPSLAARVVGASYAVKQNTDRLRGLCEGDLTGRAEGRN
jgi:hypothetical protein